MKVAFRILFIMIFSLNLYALEVDESSSNLDVLSHSHLFLDESGSLSKTEVLKQDFLPNTQSVVGFGFVPNKTLWIKFTLKNSSDKSISKLLEYANPMAEYLTFYDGNETQLNGMLQMPQERSSLHPSFEIILNAHEEKTFYIQAHSHISALIANLVLWNKEDFLKKDYKHKSYIFIFFTIIATLLVYNFMLWIFTKDRAYFYYILYLIGVLFFQAVYVGVIQLYLLSNELSEIITKTSMLYISFLIISIVLFTREFLNTSQFKKLDTVLKAYLYITPIVALLSYDNFLFNLNIIAFFIPLGFFVLFIGFYALSNGVKQAKFYVIGWSFVIVSLLLTNLRTMNFFDISVYFAYINEFAFASEALLFSVALAHRINILNQEKELANARLFAIGQKQKEELKELVEEKTKDLSSALEEKEILYKELNHRVKNNLQMILSLIKLQINQTDAQGTKEQLNITKNRIHSITKLYELLHLREENVNFNTLPYFEKIVQSVKENFSKNITIDYKITHDVKVQNLIYCGLILNELVTNSFKHAFKDDGEIHINIHKNRGIVSLRVQDSGKGFKQENFNSLGLTIVETLVTKQLEGEMHIDSISGCTTTITWREDV